MPKGEEEEQEVEYLFEKIMKEKFSNLAKEISPGITENPKQVGPKENHTKKYHN